MRLIRIARNKPNECRIIYGTHAGILHINRISIRNRDFFSGFFYQFISTFIGLCAAYKRKTQYASKDCIYYSFHENTSADFYSSLPYTINMLSLGIGLSAR